MDFNRCCRCGSFFHSDGNVCPNCLPKDLCEIANLKSFFSTNNLPNTIEDISICTGISTKNINRFFNDEQFSEISEKFKKDII